MSGVAAEAADLCLPLVLRFEGVRLRPYICPAGVPTIGAGATHYLDGRAVKLTDAPISREAAVRLAVMMLRQTYVPGTRALCPNATGARLAALSDYAYNLGLTRLKGSTLRKRVLAGDWEGACVELKKWVRGGGRVLPGLVTRRAVEIAMIRRAR